MQFLRSNTAVIITVGPFYDKTTGVDIETALTITNERITLTADTDAGSAPTNILDNVTGATSGTANDLNYITGNDAGMMQLELAAANVNRVGRMFLSITDAANHVPVFHEFFVLPQAIYDWLTGVIVPLPANVTQLLGTAWLTPGVAGTPDVNAKLLGATAQTGRDIGASVLLSPGTGTGQVDMTSGVVKANLAQILGTALTETAGQLAAAFKKFFDKATPTGTINSIPDAVAGAASGLAIVGSNMGTATSVTGAVGSVTGAVGSVTGAVGSVTGAVGSVTGAVGSVTAGVTVTTNNDKTGYGLSSAAVQAIWDALTSALVTVGSIGKKLADWVIGTTQTGDSFARLGAPAGASVSADIAEIEAQVDDIGVAGAGLTAIPWNAAWDAEVQSEVDDALVVQRLDELLNADSDIDGVAPPAVGSVVHELLTKTAGSFTYDQTTDSLEAIRDTAPLGTAMRGTDNAALASVCTEARLAELDAANLPTDVVGVKTDTAAILVDTGTTLDGRIPAALSGAGNMKADALAVDGSTTAATNLKQSATVIYVGSVTGAATTTTLIDSALTQAATDFWKGRIIIFLTGTLKFQATDITAFDAALDKLTFTALTEAPAAADQYVIL